MDLVDAAHTESEQKKIEISDLNNKLKKSDDQLQRKLFQITKLE